MKLTRNLLLMLAAVISVGSGAGWLSCGVYADREWGEWHFFRKPRWSTHFYFYAPLGESDRNPNLLNQADREAERRYQDFVEGKHPEF